MVVPLMSDRRLKVRCVALDFDLTIFDYRQPVDTRVLIPWFDRLHERGLLVGIASGRTLADLELELRKIGLWRSEGFPHFIIHEECYIHWPSAPDAGEVADWNARCSIEVAAACGVMRAHFDACAAQIAKMGVRIETEVQETPAGLTLVLENPEGAERARLLLHEIAGSDHPARISRNHHILLATPATHHKGAALDRLRALGRLAPTEILAVGDNLNDLVMMDQSLGFHCATVGNAEPAVSRLVAERGGYQAGAPIAFGVVEVFDALFREHHGDVGVAGRPPRAVPANARP
jgi:HAD superfamily hydrolase (TIGR01484 family)